ncbi:ARL14 effector protein-like [Styela clava]|uniref:ARL14 effector protein-like n=1 Tax=Styela clava TaxID=7725 RepID=UPI00193AA114|nr:ARL14 effector protein-like [Styela clava]
MRRYSDRMQQARQIKNLQFQNPGPALDHFNPETSQRQERKLQRIIKQNQSRKKSLYDEGGCLVADGRDLCDCLMVTCPGCFYPCDTCRSSKCGIDCRTFRRWQYESVEVEGGKTRTFEPSTQKVNG